MRALIIMLTVIFLAWATSVLLAGCVTPPSDCTVEVDMLKNTTTRVCR